MCMPVCVEESLADSLLLAGSGAGGSEWEMCESISEEEPRGARSERTQKHSACWDLETPPWGDRRGDHTEHRGQSPERDRLLLYLFIYNTRTHSITRNLCMV